jgi:hypothetical protein
VYLEVGFLPASLQSLSDTFRVLYIALSLSLSLIYAVEFEDVGWEKHFPAVAGSWLYKLLSRFGTEPKIISYLNFSSKCINSV